MYRFRFSFKEKNLDQIYKNTDLSNRFEAYLSLECSFIFNSFELYKDSLPSDVKFLAKSFDDNILFDILKKMLQKNLLLTGINDMLMYSTMNVEKNMINRLDDFFIRTQVLAYGLIKIVFDKYASTFLSEEDQEIYFQNFLDLID